MIIHNNDAESMDCCYTNERSLNVIPPCNTTISQEAMKVMGVIVRQV